jgi:stalled ribosome rescue protein Dom34
MDTSANHHVAVWLDHQEARVLRVEASTFDEASIRAPNHHIHRHPEHHSAEARHQDDSKRFFHDVAHALEHADEILVLGPSTAKLHFLKYLHAHAPALAQRVVGVETVDHPTDGQVAAFARRYFLSVDRMRGLAP